MKTVLSALLMSVSIQALGVTRHGLPKDGVVAAFYTNENISYQEYTYSYPNTPVQIVRNGKYVRNESMSTGDCMALIYSFNDVPLKKMAALATSLKIVEGFNDAQAGEIRPKVINGTVVFQLHNFWLYVTKIRIGTRDGKSFTENKLRILGPDRGANLVLQYIKNCREVL